MEGPRAPADSLSAILAGNEESSLSLALGVDRVRSSSTRDMRETDDSLRKKWRSTCSMAKNHVQLPSPPESPTSKLPLSRRREIEMLSAILSEESLSATGAAREPPHSKIAMRTRDRTCLVPFDEAQQPQQPDEVLQTHGTPSITQLSHLKTELHITQEVPSIILFLHILSEILILFRNMCVQITVGLIALRGRVCSTSTLRRILTEIFKMIDGGQSLHMASRENCKYVAVIQDLQVQLELERR